jgi:3-deoxy-D-manno-octulosonic-acid transferase
VVSETDASQLKQLLPQAKIEVVGDSRYDQCLFRLSQNKPLPFTIQPNERKLMVAGSTWPEDEAVLVPTIASSTQLRWIVVPHETTPTHLAQLEQRLKTQKIDFVRSSRISAWDGKQVLLVDQVGHLAELYGFADLSFVGGSFRKQVHSVMESLACGCLTFVGPFYKNNREAIEFSSEFSSEFQPTAVQVVNSSHELTQGIQHFAKQWTSAHRQGLRERFLQKTGASAKIASKI